MSEAEKFPTTAEIKMMWQTPLMYVNVAALVGSMDVARFNARLAAAILHEYRELVQHNVALSKDGAAITDANQAFFDWQRKGGWRNFETVPEFRMLEQFFQAATDKFLKAAGVPEAEIRQRSRQVQAWATVHEGGVSHLAHCHPNSVVSGVYYVKMPEGSGSIIFDDPRGPLPPFDTKLTIRPFIGDLVLFPSWLMHQVSQNIGSEERISIAFNIPGSWATTAAVNEWFPLPE